MDAYCVSFSAKAMLGCSGVLIVCRRVYAAGGVIRGVLVGVSPVDPLTLAAVATD
jgi:hypothetical protein